MQKEKETFERLNTIAADVRNNKLTRKDLIFRKCFPDRISGQGSGYEGNVGKHLFSRVQVALKRLCPSVGRSVGRPVGRPVRQHLFFRRFSGITAPAQPTRLMPGSVSGLVLF